MNNTIEFNPKKLKELEVARNQAIQDNKESFVFYGNEILVDYAKYLIEYLKTVIK